ncbi:PKD domain-containing protein [Polluticaenibacter yanchengensis]|uniref:PKD domain-containing protein n=1 Tax=Polluticaenibacter yanchengensis TaxID=3014562 RepID=A0ABT4UL13_9BACT|nr:PKD domain-containing protein [Chitinophagaceae bacterium LY-5]
MLRSLLFILILIVCAFNGAYAQDFSNKGKDFYITFPKHADEAQAVMGLYITSDVATKGTVYVGSRTVDFNIEANTVKRIFIGPNGDVPNTEVYLNQEDGIKSNSAVRVVAEKPVVVYSHIIKTARSAATLVLPTNVWGRNYITPLYPSIGGGGGSISGRPVITVVAKEANTTVEIVTKARTITNKAAGSVLSVTLPKAGDVYQVQFEANSDISGTTVNSVALNGEACKPIAVFSSSTWSAFGCASPSGGDNLYQQLFPVGSWGKNYLTAPFKDRNSDIIRVYISEPNTSVTKLEDGATTQLLGLVNNSYYEYRTDKPTKITADKPISVVQFITSQSCYSNTISADPEMIILNPLEQTINDITVFSAHSRYVPPGQSNVNKCLLNIIIKSNAASSFKINGNAPTGSFVAIPGTDFSYLQEDVTTITLENPIQNLKADSNFMAIAYGYGNVESYGYNAGTSIRDLNRFITIKNDDAPVLTTSTCLSTNFKMYFTLPYLPLSLTWKFNGLFGDETINNPSPDSTYVVDGVTLYRFPLSGSKIINSANTYPVSIVIKTNGTDNCGGETSFDFDLNVVQKPVSGFNYASTNCINEPVTFTNTSTAGSMRIAKYLWQFGDGNTTDDINTSHAYAGTGSYHVSQTVFDEIGCESVTTKTLAFSNKPTAGYKTTAPYCENTVINFSNESAISAPSTISKLYWNFGNNKLDTTTLSVLPAISYSTVGSYQLSLKAVSETGCVSDAFVQTMNIGRGPKATFTYTNACEGTPVVLTANISDNGGANITDYAWSANNSPISQNTSSVTTAAFENITSFPASLRVTNGNGCTSEGVTLSVPLSQLPTAAFNLPSTVCLPAGEAVFVNNSTIADGTANELKYSWRSDFSNQQSTLKNGVLNFTRPGSYNVKLLVESSKGCKDSITQVISDFTEQPLLTMTTSDNSICLGEVVNFRGSGNANAADIDKWSLDFKDGNRISADADSHLYTQAGTYPVSMFYTLKNGCHSDTVMSTVVVNAKPVIEVKEPVNVTMGNSLQMPVTITATSVNTFVWSPGLYLDRTDIANPITSTQEDITYRLTVTSDKGCMSSRDIFVKYIPMPVFTNAFSPNGDGMNDTWQIRNLAEYSNASVEVFDRYGTIVFKSTGYNVPWDGTRNGKPMPVGTYYYVVNLRDGSPVFKGAITLLR